MLNSDKNKNLTLRAYITNYQKHRNKQTTETLSLKTIPHTPVQKPSSQLFEQINQKLNTIKKMITKGDLTKLRNTILQYVFDIEGIVDGLFNRIKLIEDKIQAHKMSSKEIETPTTSLKLKKSSTAIETHGKTSEKQIKNIEELMSPKMARDLNFSITLTNLCASTTTHAFTPKSKSQNRLNSIQDIIQPQPDKFFKKKDSVGTEKIEKEVFDDLDASIKYKITVPKCES